MSTYHEEGQKQAGGPPAKGLLAWASARRAPEMLLFERHLPCACGHTAGQGSPSAKGVRRGTTRVGGAAVAVTAGVENKKLFVDTSGNCQ